MTLNLRDPHSGDEALSFTLQPAKPKLLTTIRHAYADARHTHHLCIEAETYTTRGLDSHVAPGFKGRARRMGGVAFGVTGSLAC